MPNLYEASDYSRVLDEKEESDLGRSPFRRDYGRLLHSPSFRRLQGKTQLFPGHETDFFRNRLTHSLEVAQVAKGIAELLNARDLVKFTQKLDVDLIEFAGLAHDLGHPPFGHNGEKALDKCMRLHGGFEGNAQTLRILSRVEKKVHSGDRDGDSCGITEAGVDRRLGLNLTYRSMASILKYDEEIPSERDENAALVKGYYNSERNLVSKIKSSVKRADSGTAFKTIECQVMDIADDIAYCTYDLEDAMKGGFSHPMQLLARVFGDAELLKKLITKVDKEVAGVTEKEIYTALSEIFFLDTSVGSLEQYAQSKLTASDAKLRSEFTSAMIGDFIRGIGIDTGTTEDLRFAKLTVDRSIKIQIESVKHLNFLLTIMSPRLKIVEFRGYEVVQTIFNTLCDEKDGWLLLPDDIQVMHGRLKDEVDRRRLVCDFVAGMTDRYAIEFYSRLKESGPSIFKPF
ncbi:MAG: dNTP triphosphohydrolase [Rhodoferax sp.]|nr:dNTP triphosphohydrolase [Rhodoferax sp.]